MLFSCFLIYYDQRARYINFLCLYFCVKTEQKEQNKFVKTSNVSLTAVDVHGRSIVHHAMKTCNHGTYENVPLLELLVELGAPTDLKDRHGQTPLDYALRGGTSKMACALQRLMKVPEDKWVRHHKFFALS